MSYRINLLAVPIALLAASASASVDAVGGDHAVDTTRASPAWSMDASVPPATVSNNEGSMFKVGETWTSPEPGGQRFRMKAIAATTEGFTVEVAPI